MADDGFDPSILNADQLRARLHDLREEHRALDDAVAMLIESGVIDQLKIARLKKRKLMIKDLIARVEDQLNPDIIA